MKQTIFSFIVALSLLVAPAAHATEVGFQGIQCQVPDKATEHSDSEKQDDGKMAKAGHHCCCQQISAQLPMALTVPQGMTNQTAVFLFKDEVVRSVVVGPPLKPPSRA